MNEPLDKFNILLAVTGGIAVYKTADLCSRLCRLGADVIVVMTDHARQFVAPLTFSSLTGNKVYTDLFRDREVYETRHIGLTDMADLIVVAPATANIIAKMAQGICDDLVSTLLCSAGSDILIAPAMNDRMWHHAATQRNLKTLQDDAVHVVGPATGRLACGTEGIGRMSEPQEILEKVIELLNHRRPKAMGTEL